jgi:hypothetical protein
MDGAGHNYITFTDNPAVDFGSAAAIGTFSAEKQGYYQADNVTRTMRFYIDQIGESYFNLIENCNPNLTPMTLRFDRMRVGISGNYAGIGTITFDTIYDDLLGSWDTVNYRFICIESGYYFISLQSYNSSIFSCSLLVNAVTHLTTYNSVSVEIASGSCLIYLTIGDIITVTKNGAGTISAGESYSFLQIARLL